MNFPVENIPPSDLVHRATFTYPPSAHDRRWIFRTIGNGLDRLESVFWDKYKPASSMHQFGTARAVSMTAEKEQHISYDGFKSAAVATLEAIPVRADMVLRVEHNPTEPSAAPDQAHCDLIIKYLGAAKSYPKLKGNDYALFIERLETALTLTPPP